MEDYFFFTKNMTVGYDGVPLIKDIKIGLKKGEILTLIGPNGAGKSTILKSITGQLSLLGGTVFLEGEKLNGISEKERAKKLSLVLTDRIRPEMMTSQEVVEMGRYPYTGRLGILSEEDKEIVSKTMELVHITEFAGKEFLTLSDGQKQMVMLAKAIAQEPKVLILDEPTSYLDIRYKLEFLSVLQRLTKRKGLTVIMSLHELDLAGRISDKILCVKGEYTERFGTVDEVMTDSYIRELYNIEAGSFDGTFGSPELPLIRGEAKVFVIAGNDSGTLLFRRLQREQIPFSTGILWENDRDISSAEALSVKVIKEKAFCRIKKERVMEAKKEIDRAEKVVCTLTDFGEWNMENKELMLYARDRGKLCGIDTLFKG